MAEQILLVDDDPQILRGYTRLLQNNFQIVTALSGQQGLEAIDQAGPYAIVVADMRMPQMDGVQFLAEVKKRTPHTIRVMLTGNADLQTAIDAVNQGNIFRFLTKPCPIDIMTRVLKAGIEQYRLVTAERELLEKTLNGSVKLLIEILSLSNPIVFSRANRITNWVGQMATQLQLPDVWRFKLAAMLCQIGYIGLPHEIINKIEARIPLTEAEQKAFLEHPAVGRQLLAHIPRMELIAQMIENQLQPYSHSPVSPQQLNSDKDIIALGAQLIRLALDLDQQIIQGLSEQAALTILGKRPDEYNPYLLAVLGSAAQSEVIYEFREIRLVELELGMVLDRDVWSRNGVLLVQQGEEVTFTTLIRLRNFAGGVGIREPLYIRVNASTPEAE
ncbi:MAG: response regulator [Anaerolineales bacterium]|nr:response regulator [Anaerolineales bacterium]